MKNNQHISANDAFDNRLNISNHQHRVPKTKLATGSIIGLYPVILDNGRTIIYTSDKSKESEIRSKYELRRTGNSEVSG
jgi:hypothetical protein